MLDGEEKMLNFDNIKEVQQYLQQQPWVLGALIVVGVFFVYKIVMSMHEKKSPYGFERVAGMYELKKKIYQDVIFPFYNAERYKKFNLTLPNGIIFYGPTGCGKTFFVECLAEELNMNFIKVSHADLASPYVHESVAKIAETFEHAKSVKPCIVFFDEIESLVPARAKLSADITYKKEEVDEFLTHLNNASKEGILVIGATNHIDVIDPAVQRSGRFDLKIYVSPPDDDARAELFYKALKEIPHDKEIDFSELSRLTANYTSADIVNIVQSTARYAVVSDHKQISQKMLERSISEIPSSLDMSELEYNEYETL
ncbi:MAG: ATP-binding protein [Rhodospirillales bacterium]|nr:ATP-binding protein [Rhodospirillales bacterium]